MGPSSSVFVCAAEQTSNPCWTTACSVATSAWGTSTCTPTSSRCLCAKASGSSRPTPPRTPTRGRRVGAQSMSPTPRAGQWYGRTTRYCFRCMDYAEPAVGHCMQCGDLLGNPLGLLGVHFGVQDGRHGLDWHVPPDPAADAHPIARRRARRTIHVARGPLE